MGTHEELEKFLEFIKMKNYGPADSEEEEIRRFLEFRVELAKKSRKNIKKKNGIYEFKEYSLY